MHAKVLMGEVSRCLGFALKFFSKERKEWREGRREGGKKTEKGLDEVIVAKC